jgi:outer membrane receptor protein involved in Fe transport
MPREHRLVYGFETYHDRVRSSRIVNDNNATIEKRPAFPDKSAYHSYAAFLEDRWQALPWTIFTLGFRLSYFQIYAPLESPFSELHDNDNDLTAALSCQIFPDPHWQFYAGYARGFRAPNLDDAVVLNETNQGIDAPNPDLSAEYCSYFEVGCKHQSDRISGSGSLFANKMIDLIDRRPGSYLGETYYDANDNGIRDEGELDIYVKQNVGEAVIYGAEYQTRILLYDIWTLWINAQWTWGKNLIDDEPLSRIPPLIGNLGIRKQMGSHLWGETYIMAAGAQTRVSERDISDSRIGKDGTAGWATLNLRFGWHTGSLKCNLFLENLTDTEYKTHGSGIYYPGRNIILKATLFVR